MPIFNPDVPQSPDYPYFWSRPTQEPKPNLGGEYMGRAIGSAITGGTEGITAAYEKGIQTEIHKQVDPIQDEYLSQLHSADQALRGQDTPDPSQAHPRNFSELARLPTQLDKLESARANGKISQTDYDARLMQVTKDVRGKYPGFRNYVDEEVKRITGRDPANQYIRSVVQDINSFVDEKRSGQKALENRFMTAAMKYSDGFVWYQKIKQDPDKYGAPALQWLNGMETKDHDLEISSKLIENKEKMDTLTRKEREDITTKGINDSGAHYYTHKLDSMAMHLGTDPQTNQEYQDALNAERRGEFIKLNEQQKAVLRTFLQTNRGALMQERAADLQNHYPDMKFTDIQKVVEDELKTYYDPWMDALGKGDYSQAELQKNLIKAKSIEAATPYFDGNKWALTHRVVTGLKEVGDPLYETIVNQAGIQAGTEQSGDLVTAAAHAVAKPEDGGKHLKQLIEEWNNKGIKDGQSYKSLVEVYAALAQKGPNAISDESADRLIDSAFGPDSGDMINYFAPDGFAPGKPGQLPQRNLGKQWFFNTMTSDGMIDRIAKRSKEDPTKYQNFEDFTVNGVMKLLGDQEFIREAPPAPPERAVITPHSLGGLIPGSKPDQGISADYDASTQTFSFRAGGGQVHRSDLDQLAANVSRMAKVIEHNPNHPNTDLNAAVLHILQGMQGEPGSVIDTMIKAMQKSAE